MVGGRAPALLGLGDGPGTLAAGAGRFRTASVTFALGAAAGISFGLVASVEPPRGCAAVVVRPADGGGEGTDGAGGVSFRDFLDALG